MVHSDGEIYDSLDPLVDYSSLSLFPLSFNSQSTSVDNPNPNFPTVDSVHSRLKAMVLRSPEKLLKQAKTVLDDSLNLLKTDKTCAMASEDKTDAIFGTNEKDHQVKRPALGLKRAKFNAKSMPRQSDAVLEPSIDIDKLDDPEKFFAAYERMENAKKELQRLRGQPLKELNQNLSSLSPRRRRPSLMGKSATYKHHSYSSTAKDDNNETLLSSEETFVHRIASQVHQDVPSETNAVVTLPNARVHDSTTTKTTKVSELDELLSCDYDGLDEAGVVNLLQEKLDIRLKDIGKTSVLDLHDIRPRKSVSSGEAFIKLKDSISQVNGLRKAIHGELLATDSQSKDSTVQMSPVWPKSPLSSISLLNRHISKLAPVVDPFSAIDIDSSPAKSSPLTQHEKQSGLSDARREVYESQRSAVHAEESTAVASPLLTVNDIASGSQAEDQLAKVGQFDQAGITEHLHDVGKSSVQVEESNAVCGWELPLSLEKRAATDEPKEWVGVSQSDQVERREVLCEIVKSPAHFNERVADTCLDLVEFAARDVDTICENKERENEVVKDDETVRQELNFELSNMETSTVNEVEGCGVGEASIAEDICSKRPTTATRGSKRKLGEKKSKVSSQTCPNEPVDKGTEANTVSNTNALMEIANKRRKQVGVAPAPRKRNEQRRNSLYVAGTKWEAGVRRSTRIKMRPLEYWKGERFLYGRVHDSLVTVIGVKYASPSKEVEQPRIKVKSFVSDQYKDKVEVAALY